MTKKIKKTKNAKASLKKYLKNCLIAFGILSIPGTIFMTGFLSENRTTQYPEPTDNFFIEDYSGVFTEETESYIMQQAVMLQNATKAQIVVVSVPDTQEDSLENYSHTLANKWGIGDAELDNGVLLLFTTKEPHVRMEVGRGLEGCLPDGKAGRILDEWAVNAKDSGRWNEAARNTWVATAKVVYEEYGLEIPAELSAVDEVSEEVTGATFADVEFPEALVEKNSSPIWMQIFVAFVVFWVFAGVPFLFFCFINYGRDTSSSGGYHGSGSGWGSSGWSGGDSGYSGGGGSFGGGGASR